MNPEARGIIRDVVENSYPVLDLNNCGLQDLELPEGDLSFIKVLVVNNNFLSKLPDDISRLSNLNVLIASNNEIDILPDGICELKYLETLELNENELEMLPENIGKLSNLNKLNISLNSISALPESFSNLTNLASVDISENALTSLPSRFGQLIKLALLNISENEINALPNDLESLSKLRFFYAQINNLTVLPESFCQLGSLSDLNLASNHLKELPDKFSNLLQLAKLDLSFNKLEFLPPDFFKLINLRTLNLQSNNLIKLPSDISKLRFLNTLDLSLNNLINLPDDFDSIRRLMYLNLSFNELTELPKGFCNLRTLGELNISNNKLTKLPEGFANLRRLTSCNLRNNLIDEFPSELSDLKNARLMIDYRGNPFLERALQRTQRFTKIWKDTPVHFRELLKIYFSGFSIFYTEKTDKPIEFNVINETDGLAFDLKPDDETDPEVVEKLLNEYFDILKTKLAEGAVTGQVFPDGLAGKAEFYAQMQAASFAQNVVQVRTAIDGYVTKTDMYESVVGSLREMQSEYHSLLVRYTKLERQLQGNREQFIAIEAKSMVQDTVMEQQWEVMKLQAQQSISLHLEQNQTIHIHNQIGNDFEQLRRLLDPILNSFDKRAGEQLQDKLDEVASNPGKLKPEEKKSLVTKLKRWVENAKEAMKVGKEAGEVVGEASKYWDKLKDFAESVLNDPDLAETIRQAGDAIF
ncbi:hypothetical protein GCM10028805_47120 [Spirosoma harenae]